MLALGTIVGGSFFLGTGVILKTAGLGTLLAFALGGFIVYLIVMALSEMTVTRPTHGSFRGFAEVAFGPMAGFLTGWLYWTGLVLALSSEATALALFARLWLPAMPVWMLSLTVIVTVAALNLLDVSLFTVLESAMAAFKLAAVAGFILLMAVLVAGLVPGGPPSNVGAVVARGILPGGLGSIAGAMLIVIFAYAGFEILGLAAPEAKDPNRTVPRAIMLTVATLVTLYVGAMAVVLFALPPGGIEPEVSPMVSALRHFGLPGVGSFLNFIVMTAAFSTMVAGTFALSRMLYSLAEEGQAPALFRRLTPAGAPRSAMLASVGGMLVGVVLAYVLPRQVYLFLVSSAGFSLLFAYAMILASQLVLRRREGCPPGACKMPFYPYSTWLGIILVVGAIVSMPLVPGQGAGLLAGLGLLAFFALAYLVAFRPGALPPAPGPQDALVETEDGDLLVP